MLTSWGRELDPQHVRMEYPRPQMRRDSYLNLNGEWEFAITGQETEPDAFPDRILVPFPPETELSGVRCSPQAGVYLWYRRTFFMPEGFVRGRVLLHIGAADQLAAVWVNGVSMGTHTGGYTPFTVDLTDVLTESGETTVVLRVRDDTEQSFYCRGRQRIAAGGCWYPAQSGIWQTVWCESVPEEYIHGLRIVPRVEQNAVELTVFGEGECSVLIGGYEYPIRAGETELLLLPEVRLWSPEDPYLYEMTVELGDDSVESYFAMREVHVQADENGVKRLFLNGEPYYQNGVTDAGYWPDGGYAAPSDEAMEFDIRTAKELGFNTIYKHGKVEPLRWYYHCDRLGMLVWQDIPSGGSFQRAAGREPLLPIRDRDFRLLGRASAAGREAFLAELHEIVRTLANCPCIVMWTAFYEGWGQFASQRVCAAIGRVDDTRLIDHAGGWHDQGIGQIKSVHCFGKKLALKPDGAGRALVLSAFGGYVHHVDGHSGTQKDAGSQRFDSPMRLEFALRELFQTQLREAYAAGLAASAYSQLTDVGDETTGLVTADRAVLKVPAKTLKKTLRIF